MGQGVKDRLLGIASVFAGLYLLLCLLSYTKWDPSLFTHASERVKNEGGIVGAYIADFFISLFGASSYAFPVFLVVYGVRRILLFDRKRLNTAGVLSLTLSASMLAGLISASLGEGGERGGLVGKTLGGLFASVITVPGAYILCLALFAGSLMMVSPDYMLRLFTRKKEEPVITEHRDIPVVVSSPEPLPQEDASLMEERIFRELRGLKGKETARPGRYRLPSIELLSSPSGPTGEAGAAERPLKEEIALESRLLEKRLKDFGVQGSIVQVHVGPIVSMYEFEPAPGVKINRVVSLSDDLALAMKAGNVRISPIPGKATLGIEVPNKNRETVSLRELISSETFKRSQSKLTLALGKDIFGNPVVADLTRMPHLLVAGATGSGKSVFINSTVLSFLYKARPEELKLLLIDPKLLELSAYEGIPHLISPVITGAKEASGALKKMVFEMERRYRLLADEGVRSIEGYNMAVPSEWQMPYIAVVIDELADLMFTSANEVEDSIARLAQMARAAGIHLIVATQRPSVDVITGIIKANFPARIAFQVTSRVDSRTILDAQGAEQLIGKGDMLFMLPGVRILRLHGPLARESEISAVTAFIKAQGAPDYGVFESIPTVKETEDAPATEERDEAYRKAVEFAESIGEVSISSIQRRFKIGYNRAARIMELMEEDGLVGPQKAAGKPRDFVRRRRP